MQKSAAGSGLSTKISALITNNQRNANKPRQGVVDESGLTYEGKLINICELSFTADVVFVSAVTSLMKQRWHHIKYTSHSYVADPESYENQLFISIAKFLIQHQLVEAQHHYLLLMPSIENFYSASPIYHQAILASDLAELFVSDDDYLILLPDLLDDFETTGKLRCSSPNNMRLLTKKEKERFKSCVPAAMAERFQVLCEKYTVRNLGLTRKTIEAVWRLACGVTMEGGNRRYYSFVEDHYAFRAVVEFQKYVDAMPSQERAAMLNYNIIRPEGLGELSQTFKEVWARMIGKTNECVFTIGVYFHKMAFDFLRDAEHNNSSMICDHVLNLQRQWAGLEPRVLECVSPEVYVHTPENLLAREQLVVLLDNINSRDWDKWDSDKVIQIGKKEIKVPAKVFEAYTLIDQENRAAFPNWEGVLSKIFKIFREVALSKKSFWTSANTYSWYRGFLNDDRLMQYVKADDAPESDQDDAIPYSY